MTFEWLLINTLTWFLTSLSFHLAAGANSDKKNFKAPCRRYQEQYQRYPSSEASYSVQPSSLPPQTLSLPFLGGSGIPERVAKWLVCQCRKWPKANHMLSWRPPIIPDTRFSLNRDYRWTLEDSTGQARWYPYKCLRVPQQEEVCYQTPPRQPSCTKARTWKKKIQWDKNTSKNYWENDNQ